MQCEGDSVQLQVDMHNEEFQSDGQCADVWDERTGRAGPSKRSSQDLVSARPQKVATLKEKGAGCVNPIFLSHRQGGFPPNPKKEHRLKSKQANDGSSAEGRKTTQPGSVVHPGEFSVQLSRMRGDGRVMRSITDV